MSISQDTPTPPDAFNFGPYAAIARYVLSYAGGAITAFSALHLISATDAQNLSGAVQAIATGVTTLAGGLMTLATFAVGAYGAWTRTRGAVRADAATDPKVKAVVLNDAAQAKADPNPKIISIADAKALTP